MAELILKFKEDELEDARTALDGYKWKMAVWDLDQYLRAELKYNENLPAHEDKVYEHVRDKIREILNDYNLNME
jgi:hypothetical protein